MLEGLLHVLLIAGKLPCRHQCPDNAAETNHRLAMIHEVVWIGHAVPPCARSTGLIRSRVFLVAGVVAPAKAASQSRDTCARNPVPSGVSSSVRITADGANTEMPPAFIQTRGGLWHRPMASPITAVDITLESSISLLCFAVKRVLMDRPARLTTAAAPSSETTQSPNVRPSQWINSPLREAGARERPSTTTSQPCMA